jgi:hypothetical protein
MFGPRVDHGNLRAVQPVDQTVHQGSARSPCPDDDNARPGRHLRGAGWQSEAGCSRPGDAKRQKAAA